MENDKQAKTFTGQDLALLIPTKDRPGKLDELLNSIAGQSVACGRVIVVDGAYNAKEVVTIFKARLPIEYYQSPIPGQIRQRKLGLAKLEPDNKLIGLLDDDLVLEAGAVEGMLNLWNSVEPDTAGIGFNMVNVPRHRYSRIKGFFCLDHPQMGKVMKSGMNTSINNIDADIRTQWLGGGYTVWQQKILHNHLQETINTKWAVGEDLRYSYPLSKHYPLYVCCNARVHHHHVYDQDKVNKVARYRGYKITAASLYFAGTNRELSVLLCYWMLLGLLLGRFFQSLIAMDQHNLKEAFGQLEGLLDSVIPILRHRSIKKMLEDG